MVALARQRSTGLAMWDLRACGTFRVATVCSVSCINGLGNPKKNDRGRLLSKSQRASSS